jgi:diketogulonate reductase-like aldo/keto reductase
MAAKLTETFGSMAEGLKASVRLNNGARMPWLGLGVFQIRSDDETERVVRTAIDLGYRSIDTAALYGNERGVGRAVRGCGVPREELFVTTKVWNDDMRRNRVEAAFDESLRRLGLDYVDLFLLHWPVGERIIPSWKVLEKLQRTGRVRAIGVSNYLIPHLEVLLPAAEVVPTVNQIEFHPYLQSKALVEYCRGKGIQVEAWSPLMQAGALLRDPALAAIAQRHGKTVAQVVLRWEVQSGVVTIPKSAHAERIRENADIFDFELSTGEMAAIAALDRNERNGADPMNFSF